METQRGYNVVDLGHIIAMDKRTRLHYLQDAVLRINLAHNGTPTFVVSSVSILSCRVFRPGVSIALMHYLRRMSLVNSPSQSSVNHLLHI